MVHGPAGEREQGADDGAQEGGRRDRGCGVARVSIHEVGLDGDLGEEGFSWVPADRWVGKEREGRRRKGWCGGGGEEM